ncbi:hypothetical protein AGMMS49579_06490 [Spirochaetia bacterium]|nr:hypothetical protein AGMMS49579_06490 [Spirochaetia bacterium]
MKRILQELTQPAQLQEETVNAVTLDDEPDGAFPIVQVQPDPHLYATTPLTDSGKVEI